MAKLIKLAAARMVEEAQTCLSILGIALLVLSVLAVPSNGLLADTGEGPLIGVTCLANNGCNQGASNPCKKLPGIVCSGPPETGSVCDAAGCVRCPCKGCYRGTYLCDCWCNTGLGYCSAQDTCS